MGIFSSGLEHREYAVRTAASAANTTTQAAELERKLAELAAEAVSLRAKHAAKLKEDAHALAAREAELDAQLARDARKKLVPMAKRFAVEPRAAATEILETWRSLAARCDEELGDSIDPQHLFHAFLEALDPTALARAGAPTFLESAPMSIPTSAAFAPGVAVPAVESFLREVEIQLSKALAYAPNAPDEKRFSIMREHASAIRMARALAAYDQQVARELQAERDAALHDPAWLKRQAAVQKRNHEALLVRQRFGS